MARPKGSGGVPWTLTASREVDAAANALALQISTETGHVVPVPEVRARIALAGAARLMSCAACRAGKCSRHRPQVATIMPDGKGLRGPAIGVAEVDEVSVERAAIEPELPSRAQVEAPAAPAPPDPPASLPRSDAPVQAVLPIDPPMTPVEAPKRRGRPAGSRNKPREPTAESPAYTRVVARYFELFEQARGTKPTTFTGREGNRIKAMLQNIECDKLIEMLERAFADKWFRAKGTILSFANNPDMWAGTAKTAQSAPTSRQFEDALPEGWK